MLMLRKLGCLTFTMQNRVCEIYYWQSVRVMLKGKVFIPVIPGHTGSIMTSQKKPWSHMQFIYKCDVGNSVFLFTHLNVKNQLFISRKLCL